MKTSQLSKKYENVVIQFLDFAGKKTSLKFLKNNLTFVSHFLHQNLTMCLFFYDKQLIFFIFKIIKILLYGDLLCFTSDTSLKNKDIINFKYKNIKKTIKNV